MYYSVSKNTTQAVDTLRAAQDLKNRIISTLASVYGENQAETLFDERWTCFGEVIDNCVAIVHDSVLNNVLEEEGGEI